ncbi:unnamed protein product, partial [marine sediment metagenome]
MALRNYVTHPDDSSPLVAHVVAGALQVQEVNPQDASGQPFSVRNTAFVNVDAATLPILSVQAAVGGSLKMLLRQLEVYNDGQDVAMVDLIHGGTLTGAAFAAVGGTSEFEVDTAATAITGGQVIASIFVGRDTTGKLLTNLNSALLID